MALTKLAKVGEGTYGIVYAARTNPSLNNNEVAEVVAVKRNLTDFSASGAGCVRELGTLAALKGHPFIVDLKKVSFGDPFNRINPMTPVNQHVRQMKEDKVHFVLEYAEISGEAFFRDKRRCTPFIAKSLTCQLLLGLEYIHQKGIIHRDLKPANLLIANGPQLKICDFGMSTIPCRSSPSTPGVSTSWYRAPEVCCNSNSYGREIDMWAVGCILFEMVGRYPFLYGVQDNDIDVFNSILGSMQNLVHRETVQKMFAAGKSLRLKPNATPIRRRSYLEQLQLSDSYVREFNASPGTLDQFLEVINGLLTLDPDERWTLERTLQHPFFDFFRQYIEGVHVKYPPVQSPLPIVRIVNCIERKWIGLLSYAIAGMRDRLDWYKHRVLFHAIDLFDRYLEWAFTPGNAKVHLGAIETEHMGRLHSPTDTTLRFYICLYLSHKYFTIMSYPFEWKLFAPSIYTTPQADLIAEQFENLLITDVCQYDLYRPTLIEIQDQYNQPIDDLSITKLLVAYLSVTSWEKQSVRALCRSLLGIQTAPAS